jgi:hypothetical protein
MSTVCVCVCVFVCVYLCMHLCFEACVLCLALPILWLPRPILPATHLSHNRAEIFTFLHRLAALLGAGFTPVLPSVLDLVSSIDNRVRDCGCLSAVIFSRFSDDKLVRNSCF